MFKLIKKLLINFNLIIQMEIEKALLISMKCLDFFKKLAYRLNKSFCHETKAITQPGSFGKALPMTN